MCRRSVVTPQDPTTNTCRVFSRPPTHQGRPQPPPPLPTQAHPPTLASTRRRSRTERPAWSQRPRRVAMSSSSRYRPSCQLRRTAFATRHPQQRAAQHDAWAEGRRAASSRCTTPCYCADGRSWCLVPGARRTVQTAGACHHRAVFPGVHTWRHGRTTPLRLLTHSMTLPRTCIHARTRTRSRTRTRIRTHTRARSLHALTRYRT